MCFKHSNLFFVAASNPSFVGSTSVLLVNIQLVLVETRIYWWNLSCFEDTYPSSPDRKMEKRWSTSAKTPSSCNPAPLHTTGLPTISKHKVTRSLTPRLAPEIRLNMPQPWMLMTRKIDVQNSVGLLLRNVWAIPIVSSVSTIFLICPWTFHECSMYFHIFRCISMNFHIVPMWHITFVGANHCLIT